MPSGVESIPPVSRSERASTTRKALIDTATRLFSLQGYSNTGTEEIVAAAGVGTRGALYHHFADKEALFAEVFKVLQADLFRDIFIRVGPTISRPLDGILNTSLAFLDCIIEREDARAVLRDGPVALGWDQFRLLESHFALGTIKNFLDAAMQKGLMAQTETEPLASLVLALMNEAAVYVSTASDPLVAKSQMGVALSSLINGLRL